VKNESIEPELIAVVISMGKHAEFHPTKVVEGKKLLDGLLRIPCRHKHLRNQGKPNNYKKGLNSFTEACYHGLLCGRETIFTGDCAMGLNLAS
jgi:hypothetical protein